MKVVNVQLTYNAQGNYRAAIAELETYLRLSPAVKDAPENSPDYCGVGIARPPDLRETAAMNRLSHGVRSVCSRN